MSLNKFLYVACFFVNQASCIESSQMEVDVKHPSSKLSSGLLQAPRTSQKNPRGRAKRQRDQTQAEKAYTPLPRPEVPITTQYHINNLREVFPEVIRLLNECEKELRVHMNGLKQKRKELENKQTKEEKEELDSYRHFPDDSKTLTCELNRELHELYRELPKVAAVLCGINSMRCRINMVNGNLSKPLWVGCAVFSSLSVRDSFESLCKKLVEMGVNNTNMNNVIEFFREKTKYIPRLEIPTDFVYEGW